MTEDHFDQLLDLRNAILGRKLVVKDQIKEWSNHQDCDCSSTPDCPCCLLMSELELLTKYNDILERELWHIRNHHK